MRGTMLWFNDEKNLGVIVAEDGERVSVEGSEFGPEGGPVGRCGGLEVTFRLVDGEERKAADVILVERAEPRRARRRHGRSFS